MTFNEMLTFWTISGKLKQVDPGVGNGWKGKKKVKIRIANQHSLFIKYNDTGPLAATIYFDNGHNFQQVVDGFIDGSPETVLETLKMWIKDLQ